MSVLLPEALTRLIHELKKLPGIGEKSAARLALHILTSKRVDPAALAKALAELRDRVRPCAICGFYTDQVECGICRDGGRDGRVLCVVEHPSDLIALERSGGFRGRYHVLGGSLSPIDGVGPDELRIRELVARVASGGIGEVILATGTGVGGEATAVYIARLLKDRQVKVTRLAHGVPIGSDLEYLDGATLERALSGRRDF